jgi:linoleoyl-CoA desaturase
MENIRFTKEQTPFYAELRAAVDHYFKSNNMSYRANNQMIFKISFMFFIYLFAYACIYIFNENTSIFYSLYAFIGGWSVLLGLNIGHDAAHNAIFKKKQNNEILLFIFELLGTNAYNWKNRHLGAHHVFPNVMNQDSDIQQTNLVKIFPKDKHKTFHAFQFLYMPFLYMLYILRWVIYRDFKDARSAKIGAFNNSNYPRKEIIKMIFFKLFYMLYIVVLPALFLNYGVGETLLAFFILTISGSLVITMVLLSTHVGEDACFPEPDKNGVLPYSWSYHQVITAADFGTQSWLLNQLFGGFNHHVIHHLFPHICHVHYPAMTPILKEFSAKYNLPYRHKKYLLAAMFSHFKLLFRNGKKQEIAIH